ncbi:MAG TPA: metabolite traffic protein EboE [Afifellaceae bacterium]|nr:metabolite traffic protein EboE [Afifellaceae bacterium]
MRLQTAGGPAHLTYCTNIHPAESAPEVLASLETHLPEVKRRVSPEAPMGVGLRLGAEAAAALEAEQLETLLDRLGCYVFTINGFPYGPFHGQAVKESVYRPDWSRPERLAYTTKLADLLAGLLPEDCAGSLSTVPVTFKAWADEATIEAAVANLVDCAAHLSRLEQETGRKIVLALEPEPCCLLETIAETVAFFDERLFAPDGVARFASASGRDRGSAEEALRRHLGLCYDVCHAAVEFEDPEESFAALETAGIAVAKLQISAALRLPRVDGRAVDALRRFDEALYLHQVVARRNGVLTRYADIPQAMAARAAAPADEWRVHFHVPIFLDEVAPFATTQPFLEAVLERQRTRPVSEHLEVETYTWDVLPPELRLDDLGASIARELDWVKGRLAE